MTMSYFLLIFVRATLTTKVPTQKLAKNELSEFFLTTDIKKLNPTFERDRSEQKKIQVVKKKSTDRSSLCWLLGSQSTFQFIESEAYLLLLKRGQVID